MTFAIATSALAALPAKEQVGSLRACDVALTARRDLTARSSRIPSARRSLRVACSQGKRDAGSDGAISYKDTLNSFFDKFLPTRRQQPEPAGTEGKRTGMSIEEMRDLLADIIQRDQWFITGNVDRGLFARDFVFGDPSVNVVGVDNYADGVRRLFDQTVSRLDIISAEVVNPSQILIVWRLEGRVNLPFKPTLKPYIVRTTYTVDKQGLLCRQEETFDIPSWDVVLSAFFPFIGYAIGAPAAPPVRAKR